MRRIILSGFKSFRRLDEFTLGDLNILVGPKDAGKSNLVSFFEMLAKLAENNLQSYVQRCGGPAGILHGGNDPARKLEAGLFFEDETFINGYEFVLETPLEPLPGIPPNLPRRATNPGLVFDGEALFFLGKGFTHPFYTYLHPHDGPNNGGYRETKLPGGGNHQKPTEWHILELLKNMRTYDFHNVGISSTFKIPGCFSKNPVQTFGRLDRNGSNLAAFLFYLKAGYPAHYRKMIPAIRFAEPSFEGFRFRSLGHNAFKAMVTWKGKDFADNLDFNQLRGATRKWLCLAALFAQPDPPSTIILDEPARGLTNVAGKLLAEWIRACARKTQVIVTSKPNLWVGHFEPENVIYVKKENGQSRLQRPLLPVYYKETNSSCPCEISTVKERAL